MRHARQSRFRADGMTLQVAAEVGGRSPESDNRHSAARARMQSAPIAPILNKTADEIPRLLLRELKEAAAPAQVVGHERGNESGRARVVEGRLGDAEGEIFAHRKMLTVRSGTYGVPAHYHAEPGRFGERGEMPRLCGRYRRVCGAGKQLSDRCAVGSS